MGRQPHDSVQVPNGHTSFRLVTDGKTDDIVDKQCVEQPKGEAL